MVFRPMSLKGKVEFLNATAKGHGGGIYMEAGRLDASHLSFKGCTAEHDGAAIFVQGPATLQHLETEQCTSSVSSAVLYAKGNLRVSDLTTSMRPSKTGSGNQHLNSAGAAHLTSWMCKSQQKCALLAEKGGNITKMSCSPGTGFMTLSSSIQGCFVCPPGSLRLGYSAEYNWCYSCPENTEVCHPKELKMPFGMSLIPTELAFNTIYCPNPEACPGGRLATEDSDHFLFKTIEEVQEITIAAMCAEGYIGEGCFQCSKNYSIADGNPLTCTACPSWSTNFVARGIAFYAAKDLILFLSATVNAIAASPVKRKQSAVLLNQLMAFATVSNILCSGIMYTKTFHNITSATRRVLQRMQIPVDLAQVQGDETLSKQCLLRHFGLPDSLGHTHLASMIFPASLMAMLAIKDPFLSLVVGTNVFLPGFTAAFGKYLIAFRMQPQSAGGQLEMPFLPGFGATFDILAVFGAVLLCFAFGILGWWHMTQTNGKDQDEVPPQHVLYLIQSYTPESRSWEIERLVRKMILSFITCAIPVSYSPALQTEAVSLTLLTSLVLYTMLLPYKETWSKVQPFSMINIYIYFVFSTFHHFSRDFQIYHLMMC